MDCIYCHKDHEGECPLVLAEERKAKAAAKAEALVEQLGRFVNGMNHEESDAFATALANEHPTLLGQIAKAVGIGVMRRSVYDPTWKPYDRYPRGCPTAFHDDSGNSVYHSDHDGRLSCATVVGAELMARQSYI
jgi:hypothetical protein